MSTEKMTIEEAKELIQSGMDATDKIRLLISDVLIVHHRSDYSSLEVAIAGFVKELRAQRMFTRVLVCHLTRKGC